MSSVNDKIDVTEQVFADLIKSGTAADAAPRYPCPVCGKETKEHHTPHGSRICSSRECRKIIAHPEHIAMSKRAGDALQPVVVPCSVCGKPTKEHHTPHGSRICSSTECRAVMMPGSFADPHAGKDGTWVAPKG